ncbi:MAG: TlpA family protein disulfide reductase [Chloroflexi bacterium]|nr:TlpA family protein disulfide reductase [Chloroflexota bacterium]
MTSRIVVAAPIALLVLGMLALFGFALQRAQGPGAGFGINQIGMPVALKERPAPAFAVTGFDGQPLRMDDLRGQVVVLNFWASWCPPCRQEAPILERVWRAYKGRGVVFVGLGIWDRDEDAQAFLKDFGITYRNGADRTGEVAIAYGVTGLPETFFITREGWIARKWVGPLSDQQLSGVIDELLR